MDFVVRVWFKPYFSLLINHIVGKASFLFYGFKIMNPLFLWSIVHCYKVGLADINKSMPKPGRYFYIQTGTESHHFHFLYFPFFIIALHEKHPLTINYGINLNTLIKMEMAIGLIVFLTIFAGC